MESQHSVDDLRSMMRSLHNKIETLEGSPTVMSDAQYRKFRKRIHEAKIQEATILTKLAESGIKL